MKTNRNYGCTTSFLDLLFNMLLAFTALFVLSFALINQSKESSKSNVEVKAEYIISISWPEDLDYDIDIYVQDPLDNLVCFKRREEGLMHLERDDLGHRNDMVQTPRGPVAYNVNKEYVTLRGFHPGEYVVNVHAYRVPENSRCKVTVTVDKINPKVQTILSGTVELNGPGDEKTVGRFTLGKDGEMTGSNNLFKKLVKGGK